jgi:hypothetical protein
MDDDPAKLHGTWQQVHYERDGVVQPLDEKTGWQPMTTIAGDRFSVTIGDGSVVLEGTFRLWPACQHFSTSAPSDDKPQDVRTLAANRFGPAAGMRCAHYSSTRSSASRASRSTAVASSTAWRFASGMSAA